MIKVSDTNEYNVNPKNMIFDAFSTSYSRYADTQKEVPPDTATLVCTVISMVLLAGMFVLTAFRYESERVLWFAMTGVAFAILGFFVYRYMKQRNAYLQAAGKPNTINTKRAEFVGLFGNVEELDQTMLAGDFQDQVKRLRDREQDEVRKNALKAVFDDLTVINNPDLPVCRLVTTLPERFTQPRARLYMKKSGDKFVFFDINWANPVGQIECDEDDIISFGRFSSYPASINTSGGKIRPESGILEIANEGGTPVYLDFVDDEFEKALKLLPKRKEKKQ
ncbi:MAG: hypothetical protein J5950_02075 [Clostridia bacterium]|nr:hypothetical protein [Clostridia bacterium]